MDSVTCQLGAVLHAAHEMDCKWAAVLLHARVTSELGRLEMLIAKMLIVVNRSVRSCALN